MCDVLIMADKNNPAQGFSGRSSRKKPPARIGRGLITTWLFRRRTAPE
jgi:hypothetical protein